MDFDITSDSSVADDVIVDGTHTFINNYNDIMNSYKTNAVPDNSQKYSYIQQQIKDIQNIAMAPIERTNVLNKIEIDNDIHVILHNIDEYNSSVVKKEGGILGQHKYSVRLIGILSGRGLFFVLVTIVGNLK